MRDEPVRIRLALASEPRALEALQMRASLANPGDREGVVQGFAAILPREDGDVELDALFVEPNTWRRGCGRAARFAPADDPQAPGSAAPSTSAMPMKWMNHPGNATGTGIAAASTGITNFMLPAIRNTRASSA
jgi:hypothetical protein